jgi:hypothetical protein
MHLLHRFGLDAETMTILKGSRPPRSFEDAKELLVAGSLHTFWGRVLDAKKDAITATITHSSPYASPRDPYTAAQSAVIVAFEKLSPLPSE